MITYIIANVPPDRVDAVVSLARLSQGQLVSKEVEDDGEYTLTFSFPDDKDGAPTAAKAAAPKASAQEPPWLTIARQEIGTFEIPGAEDNSRIVAYHAATTGGASPDEVPWCSSFVNWCMREARVQPTGSKRARSWAAWGKDVQADPPIGCVVVLSRGGDPALGHVGFLVGTAPGRVRLLGGNQNDRVSEDSYPSSRVVAMRMAG